MHNEAIKYVWSVYDKHPKAFINKIVLDVGSMDINGNNRSFFEGCHYTGLDLGHGKNVDVICPIHKYNPGILYDTIICTEMLEHDEHYKQSLQNMYKLLKPGGLLVLTAASNNRPEHGTKRTTPHASPNTPDYYQNITLNMLVNSLQPGLFAESQTTQSPDLRDIYFYGIKK